MKRVQSRFRRRHRTSRAGAARARGVARGVVLLAVLAAGAACKAPDYEAYLRSQLRYLRAGVDIEQEEREVRRVLSQRRQEVVAEVRRPGFVALGARSADGRLSSVRVITQRGVVVAEDADREDLFAPSELRLLEKFPASVGEYVLVAMTRTPAERDLGCAAVYNLLPDGSATRAVLDASALGSRACVAELHREASGRLKARVAFPALFAIQTPAIEVDLAFQRLPLGQPAPPIPVLKVTTDGSWLEAARAQLSQPLPPDAPFSQRHAVGVGRAAVALAAGQDRDAQVAAYREAVGRVLPGSPESEIVADALQHIERGWLDPTGDEEALAAEEPSEAPDGVTVIAPSDAGEEHLLIEASGEEAEEAPASDDAIVIEPTQRP